MLSTPVIRGVQEIGPYQVLEGRGPAPCGIAYLAADTRSDRTVMLKVIPASRPGSWQEGASWEMLLDETAALGRIYHRGIPGLVEIADYEGALVVAFAPAQGRSLYDLLAAGERPDRATLVDWGCQLLDILAEAHRHGILHRHLSEEEVMLAPGGQVVLAGFGLTRLAFDSLITPPPEQVAGEPYTARSDLYAVGSLLRRLAFAAGALRGGRGSLGHRDPLLKVLVRATFMDPATRYETAAEMAEALREAGRPEAGAPPRNAVGSGGAGAQVAIFPGPPLRLVTAQSSGAPSPRGREDDDLWRSLVLLAVSLLLLAFVLATSWSLLGRDRPPWRSDPLGAPSTPPATLSVPSPR